MKKILNSIKGLFKSNKPQHRVTLEPYVIKYSNPTDKPLQAKLFGFNEFNGVSNFGNDEGIIVSSLQGVEYRRLFNETSNKPFKTGEFRFMCSNDLQLKGDIIIKHCEASGMERTSTLNLGNFMDIYQYQSDIIVLKKKITVHAGMFISFEMKPKTELVISVYPINISSIDSLFKDDEEYAKRYYIPIINGQKISPVIVQTNIKSTYSKVKSFFKRLFNKKQS